MVFFPSSKSSFLAGWPDRLVSQLGVKLDLHYSYNDGTAIYICNRNDREYVLEDRDALVWEVDLESGAVDETC